MEVAQIIDRVTHAVIGGMEAESMGIADDPAFYHMLSSTLYSDEKKAVIRETLCNAWDAHIEAGCTDRAVEVSLTSDKLTIQDFGLGICRHMIKPIYGVYGSSTKKANANVTGGFGLGCKAPFAYVDHFEVISCHQGEKTIYRMSKSSGAVMGKPSIQPIVTVPTTETGITVSLAIKDISDRNRFAELVRSVAAQGEMKVSFNGVLVDPLPFSEAKNGYLIMPQQKLGEATRSINIRYGNVIYPVEENPFIREGYLFATRFLQNFTKTDRWSNEGEKWAIIFMAEPNTISVTPSRESLSMSEHTLITLKKLLNDFQQKAYKNHELRYEMFKLDKQAINDTWLLGRPKDLLTFKEETTCSESIQQNTEPYITDVKNAAGHVLLNHYPKNDGYMPKIINERLKSLIQGGFGKQGLLQSYRAELNRYNKRGVKDRYKRSSWFSRRLIAPVLEAIKDQPMLDAKNFGVWDDNQHSRGIRTTRGSTFITHKNYMPPNLNDCLSYARGIVIIGHSRLTINERAHRMPAMNHWYGRPERCLVYLVSRSAEKVRVANMFFHDLGFVVVDTTTEMPWDETEKEEKSAEKVEYQAAPKKKKLEGYAALTNINAGHDMEKLYAEDGGRIMQPEFVVRLSPALQTLKELEQNYFNTSGEINAVIRLFGSRGAAVPSQVAYDKLITAGTMKILPFVIQEICEAYKTLPEIENYYRHSIEHLYRHTKYQLDHDEANFFKAIQKDAVLGKKFDIMYTAPLSVLDYKIIADSLLLYGTRLYPELAELEKLIKSWTPNASIESLVAKLQNNETLSFLNGGNFTYQFRNAPEEIKKSARAMILLALKGK
jgi:hypothetical protein